MTSSIKPELHNVAQRRQRITEPRLWDLHTKFREYRSRGSRDTLADRPTDRQMGWSQYSAPLPGRSKNTTPDPLICNRVRQCLHVCRRCSEAAVVSVRPSVCLSAYKTEQLPMSVGRSMCYGARSSKWLDFSDVLNPFTANPVNVLHSAIVSNPFLTHHFNGGLDGMVLNPSNSSNLEQPALTGLRAVFVLSRYFHHHWVRNDSTQVDLQCCRGLMLMFWSGGGTFSSGWSRACASHSRVRVSVIDGNGTPQWRFGFGSVRPALRFGFG